MQLFFPTQITPSVAAALWVAEEQYAPGVTVRMNPRTFRIEYIRADGSLVPDYLYCLNRILNGEERKKTYA